MRPWQRYVDDTFTILQKDAIQSVVEQLNDYHPKIKFTFEVEQDGRLPFLDVLLIRNIHVDDKLETTVHRKPTDNSIYMKWDSFTPKTWRLGTFKTLVLRALCICSNQQYREEEINHIRHTFQRINGYPVKLTNTIIEDIESGCLAIHDNDIESKSKAWLKLPYKGKEGEKLIRSLKTVLKKQSSIDVNTQVIYGGSKLRDKFSIKDKTSFEHQHNLVYEINCPEKNCKAKYIGETGRRIDERIKEHSNPFGRSHVVEHTIKSGHLAISNSNVKVLAKIRGHTSNRKITEALYIKSRKPSINVQEASIALKLFK